MQNKVETMNDNIIYSFIFMGDGKHSRLLKNDKIFKDVIIYTYSIVGNNEISKESKKYLMNRLIKDIEKENINKKTITNLACGLGLVYQMYFIEVVDYLPKNSEEILEMAIEYKDVILGKNLEQTYFKQLIVACIIYNTIYKDDRAMAFELYQEIRDLSYNLPGEKLELFRVEHIIGIDNREKELDSDKYINPIFKGCKGSYELDKSINKIILDYIKNQSENL